MKSPGVAGTTGEPSPEGAAVTAVEECRPDVAGQFHLSRGARNKDFL